MAIRAEVLKAAALALSDAARGENIYLPPAKAQRLVEPVLEAAIEMGSSSTGVGPRTSRALMRDAGTAWRGDAPGVILNRMASFGEPKITHNK